VQSFIDDSLFINLDASRFKSANMFVQANQIQLQDDILQLGEKDLDIFQVQNIQYYDSVYNSNNGAVAAVYIRSDKTYQSISRQVYDILTFLGNIGGLYGALIGIGAFIIGFIN